MISEIDYNTVLLCVDYDEAVLKRYNALLKSSTIKEGTTQSFDSLYTTKRSLRLTEDRTIRYNLILALGAEDASDIAKRIHSNSREIAVAFFDLNISESNDMLPVIGPLREMFPSLVCAVAVNEEMSDRLTRPQDLFSSPSQWLYYQRRCTVEQMEQMIAHLISSFILHREKETALLKNEATRKGLRKILDASPALLRNQSQSLLVEKILQSLSDIAEVENAFLAVQDNDNAIRYVGGSGKFSSKRQYLAAGYDKKSDLFRAALAESKIVSLKDGVIMPLVVENKKIGLLFLDAEDIQNSELLDVFAHHVAFAIKNHRLQIEIKKKQALEHELNLASRIQNSLLPKSFPDATNLEIYGLTKSAKEIGGDYFDIVISGKFCYLCIGDVSGKGVPAGLIMSELRSAVRAFAMTYDSPREILLHSAELLLKDIAGSGKFVSVLLFQWDGDKLIYSSAGHEHILHYQAATGKCEAYRSGGVVLGVDYRSFSRLVKEKELPLAKGDIVVLFTDGATEAHNKEKEMFKLPKLQSTVEKYQDLPIQEMLEAILGEVLGFIGGAEQHDDITLLGMKYNPIDEQ